MYNIESLSTTIREYKTLRMCEFYGLAETIFEPQKSLARLRNPDDKHKHFASMMKFVKTHTSKFNPSQLEALKEVAHMQSDQLLLIQGPPGTGKTHTITGIISMLLEAGVEKILVCAPSNAAIDEVVTRIHSRGFVGSNQ